WPERRDGLSGAMALKKSMRLDEVQALVLGIVLRNTVVPADAAANLQELNGREFVDYAPAGLLAVRHGAIRVEKFFRDLQVVAARDEPVGFDQRGQLLTLPGGDAAVVGYLGLPQPDDGTGFEAGEDPVCALGSDGLIVAVGRDAQPPARFDVGQLSAVLLAVAGDRAACRAVADCELCIPAAVFPAEFHTLVRRRHVDAGGGENERGLVLQSQPE